MNDEPTLDKYRDTIVEIRAKDNDKNILLQNKPSSPIQPSSPTQLSLPNPLIQQNSKPMHENIQKNVFDPEAVEAMQTIINDLNRIKSDDHAVEQLFNFITTKTYDTYYDDKNIGKTIYKKRNARKYSIDNINI